MPQIEMFSADMKVLMNHIYEYQKGVRQMVLYTFNKKYEQFLDGQRDFAPLILQKRQAELQEMMEKNVAFKNESKRLLAQADAESKAALKVRLRAIVARIGADRGYAFILNTDNDAVPYVNNIVGEDINALVKDAVKR